MNEHAGVQPVPRSGRSAWRTFGKFTRFVLLSAVLAVAIYLIGLIVRSAGQSGAADAILGLLTYGLVAGLGIAAVVSLFALVLGFPFWLWARSAMMRRGWSARTSTTISAVGVALIGAIPIIHRGWRIQAMFDYPTARIVGGMVVVGILAAVFVSNRVYRDEF